MAGMTQEDYVEAALLDAFEDDSERREAARRIFAMPEPDRVQLAVEILRGVNLGSYEWGSLRMPPSRPQKPETSWQL